MIITAPISATKTQTSQAQKGEIYIKIKAKERWEINNTTSQLTKEGRLMMQ